MTGKSWRLSRRQMIKGSGVAMALPYLNAMGNTNSMASGATGTSTKTMPKRFIGTYISYGVYQPDGQSGIPRKDKDGNYEHHEWSCGHKATPAN